jgi:dimethylaniline monooxygenase (N-oxide forming)
MCEYVEAYAKHFDLHQHIRLNTTVVRVLRDETDSKWLIEVRPTNSHGVPTETHGFDRLVFATGIHLKLNWPDIKGRHRFAGEIIHGLRMKEPSKYKGKRVLIIGLALTGADCARHLAREGAEQVYCSHRRQVLLVSIATLFEILTDRKNSRLRVFQDSTCGRRQAAGATYAQQIV